MTKHIIPIGNNEPPHTTDITCFCQPTRTEVDMICHNSSDGREKLERQGIVHPHNWWVIVFSTEQPTQIKEFTD